MVAAKVVAAGMTWTIGQQKNPPTRGAVNLRLRWRSWNASARASVPARVQLPDAVRRAVQDRRTAAVWYPHTIVPSGPDNVTSPWNIS